MRHYGNKKGTMARVMMAARRIWSNSFRDVPLSCEGWLMPKMKSLTFAEQSQKFRDEAARRKSVGLPSIAEADAAVDAMIRKDIDDHGA